MKRWHVVLLKVLVGSSVCILAGAYILGGGGGGG